LVGKINNLVTVDLGNIGPCFYCYHWCSSSCCLTRYPVDSRDFLVLVIFIPLQIAFGIWFLYVLLGWSVWVGVASIVLLAPLPGYSWSPFPSGSASSHRLQWRSSSSRSRKSG
jgi:hypothetical protein